MRPRNRADFTVAIICALTLEADAVEAVFDVTYDRLGRHYGKEPGDANTYINGRIGNHNVVLCYLPRKGKGSAASVASSLQVSYRNIRLAFVVGICGGAPSIGEDQIYLGDVVISDSVVEYDYGRQYPGGFQRKTDVEDTLGGLDRRLGTFLSGLKATRTIAEFGRRVSECLDTLQQSESRWSHPGVADVLYEAAYFHRHYANNGSNFCDGAGKCTSDDICEAALNKDCDELGCDDTHIVRRRAAGESVPSVYVRKVASADTVLKSGQHRDAIVHSESVAAFEMEGAGVWNNLPCIIIKGVCDYADSHKNKLWQAYAAAAAASATKVFLEYWEPLQRDDAATAGHFMVPFMRNPRFVGRHHELQELEEWIATPDGPRKLAITGLGGVGKTQVALELAYRMRDREPRCSIFWIPCITREAVEQAYLAIADTIGIHADADSVKEQLQRYFTETKEKWLLVFDNADDIDMWTDGSGILPALQDFLPQSSQGHIIFTTRNRKTAVKMASASNYVTHVAEPGENDGLEMLRWSLIDKKLLDDTEVCITLLEQLCFLPLAITQATAFINENSIGLSDYLELLSEQEAAITELLSKEFGDEGRYQDVQNPVALTWHISFKQILEMDEMAADYLSLLACINPRDIPQSFLPQPKSKTALVETLGLLKAYSFVTLQGNGSISMHRLVSLAMRNWLKMRNKLSVYVLWAADRFEEIFPDPDHTNRQLWRQYLPHVLHLLNEAAFKEAQSKGRYLLLVDDVMGCLWKENRHREAEPLARDLMTYYQKEYGDSDRRTLSCMNDLVYCYLHQDKISQAEEVALQATSICRETLGLADTTTATSISFLVQVYVHQGRYKEAEKLQLEALSTSGDVENSLRGISNLASIYSDLGRVEEAAKLRQKVLKLETESLGVDHPDTIATMHNLAQTYESQGRLSEAEALAAQVFKTNKRVLGLKHPSTARSMATLAVIYRDQGRLKVAEELLIEAVNTSQQVLGTQHTYTLTMTSELATTYYLQERWSEAEELQDHVLKLRMEKLGPMHPDTLLSMYRLALTWRAAGGQALATQMMEECFERSAKYLGPDHPATIWSKKELGYWEDLDNAEADSIGAVSSSNKPQGLRGPGDAGEEKAPQTIRRRKREILSRLFCSM
ncbi:uncharacterized protein BDW70DRAFT_88924 [Aspergillus foveolatus]|uniref:uncharacterized protein n=1 Tax=Aspergillus foveolatus TaxID=210207 RepID=UPI003CCE4D22